MADVKSEPVREQDEIDSLALIHELAAAKQEAFPLETVDFLLAQVRKKTARSEGLQVERDNALLMVEQAREERDKHRQERDGLAARVVELEIKQGDFLAFEAAQEARRRRAAETDSVAPPRRARR